MRTQHVRCQFLVKPVMSATRPIFSLLPKGANGTCSYAAGVEVGPQPPALMQTCGTANDAWPVSPVPAPAPEPAPLMSTKEDYTKLEARGGYVLGGSEGVSGTQTPCWDEFRRDGRAEHRRPSICGSGAVSSIHTEISIPKLHHRSSQRRNAFPALKFIMRAGLRGHGATRVGRNSTSAAAIGLSRGSAVPGTRIILIARSFPQYNTARVLIPGHGQPTTVCGRMHVMAPDTDYIAQRRYGSYAYNLRAQAPPRCYSDSFSSCFWILRRK